MKKLLSILCMLLPMLAFAGSAPMEVFQSIKPPVAEGTANASEMVRDFITAAALRNKFQVVDISEHNMTLRLTGGGYQLDILATYDDKSIKLDYKDSSGLDYGVDANGAAHINGNYNKRMRKLISSLGGIALTVPLGSMEVIDGLKIATMSDQFLVVHYYRKLKDWEPRHPCYVGVCWGLHVWGDAIIGQTQWTSPVFPTGYDDFGAVYYVSRDPSSVDGDMHYILHKGDAKDQCGNDMDWDIKKGLAIFVVEGDCNVYYDAASALGSRLYVKQN